MLRWVYTSDAVKRHICRHTLRWFTALAGAFLQASTCVSVIVKSINPRAYKTTQTLTYIQYYNMADISQEDGLYLLQLQTMVVLDQLDDNESRRDYMRPVFARRKQQGDYYQLVRELEMADAEYFGRYARLSSALLEEVLQLLALISNVIGLTGFQSVQKNDS